MRANNNPADQTLAEFQNYRTPGDGRRFTEIYNVDKLTRTGVLGSSAVVISTIQRVFKVLRNEDVTPGDDPGLEALACSRTIKFFDLVDDDSDKVWWDLSNRADRKLVYERLLTYGSEATLVLYLDGALLIDL